ncbi:disease resistance protein RPM1-like [Prunus avium]|uniref:Disease resistance protein RPM1-like n=1 Tax=Prunus avium TaxID=42229 RepID=A0A6P5RW36_PRUAV|nr:disease resistance protein RPM1-like [Prunus avium]
MIAEFHRMRKESVPEGIETMDLKLLIDTLREYLKEKRYAVVFDDVWSTYLWECIKLALPENNNGSRIIITTRKTEIRRGNSSARRHFDIPRDIIHQSWSLIVSRCGGLPLAIVAINGLLQTKGEDVSQWRKLLDSLSSELESNHHLTNITKILSFSYYDLPYQLRPCFLYFGTYPENRTIRCARLIRQWIAEGFVKEQRGKTLEDVAEEYLTELIQRSLVQVSLVYFNGKRRRCQVHDVIREAVIRLRTEDLTFSQFLEEDSSFNENSRHLSVYSNAYNIFGSIKNSRAHSLCFFNGIGEPQNPLTTCSNLYKRFKLLRVLDFEGILLDNLLEEVGYMYHLKYLSLRNTRVKILPKSMGKLVNLETLDLMHSLVDQIPIEINKLHKLRSLLAYNEDKKKEFSLTRRRGVVIQDGIERWGNMQKLISKLQADDGKERNLWN